MHVALIDPSRVVLKIVSEMLTAGGHSVVDTEPMPSEKAFPILESMTGRLNMAIVEAFRPVAAAFVPRFPPNA